MNDLHGRVLCHTETAWSGCVITMHTHNVTHPLSDQSPVSELKALWKTIIMARWMQSMNAMMWMRGFRARSDRHDLALVVRKTGASMLWMTRNRRCLAGKRAKKSYIRRACFSMLLEVSGMFWMPVIFSVKPSSYFARDFAPFHLFWIRTSKWHCSINSSWISLKIELWILTYVV